MKLYVSPAVEIIEYSLDDVIAASKPERGEDSTMAEEIPTATESTEPKLPDIVDPGDDW